MTTPLPESALPDPALPESALPDPALPDPARRLAALLETLPPVERQEITAWLLNRQPGHDTGRTWVGLASSPERRAQRLTSPLATGEGNQLVTIRLPADRHAQLRQWCVDHGFTMAAVVRGLVDRFIDQQERGAA